MPRRLSLPKPGELLETEQVVRGLYLVKGAYDHRPDDFASSPLYTVRKASKPDEATTTRAANAPGDLGTL